MPNLKEPSICSLKLHSVDSVEGVFVLERQWDYEQFIEFQCFVRMFTKWYDYMKK